MDDPDELTTCPFCDGKGDHAIGSTAALVMAGKDTPAKRELGFVRAQPGRVVCWHCQGIGDLPKSVIAKLPE
ncbi:MAG: hypothetical protein AAGL17_17785 [Cyanobacteria bacterium J06576_12]